MPEPTPEFRERLKTAWESIEVGQIYTFRRTFTEGDVTMFVGITGDYNPYHTDEAFAGESWFGRRIIPGLLTASMMTHIGGMLGFLAREMHFQFVLPVYIGDTITCTVTILEKDAEKRLFFAEGSFVNQQGEEVLKATFNGFPAQVRLAK
ncbi:MAG TPA: MaoC family dehydratase [Chloroflexia bacterium]|nr:MaoC family dehydratase [Chloroflexia bacterium]